MRPPLPAPAVPRAGARFSRWMWLVLIVAGALRFYALNWDEGTLSHPDERNVLMAAHKLAWPTSIPEYLDEARSPVNPRNRETAYYAYGTLPTTLLTGVCQFAGVRLPEQQTLVGRGLSVFADLGVLWLVYLIARRLRGAERDERRGLLAALLYAGCVSPTQHAHFFVTDPYANFFVLLALWGLQRAHERGRLADYLGAGAALGCAVACKISVATLALPIALTALLAARSTTERSLRFARPGQIIARWLTFGLAALAVYRVAAPDAFSGWLTLAPRWVANMNEIIGVTQGTLDLPFTRQWVGRAKLWFPWVNMVVWGMGVPLGLCAWAGAGWAGWRIVRRREMAFLPLVSWIVVVFVHQGTQWSMTMRYFLPIYGPLIILAAALLVHVADRLPRWRWAPAAFIAGATLAWGIAFLGVYQPQYTRVRASRWIYRHIPAGSCLGVEHWDDALPLALSHSPGVDRYQFVEFPWYDPDSPAKRELTLRQFDQAGYLILASDKLYGSIPRMPHRYPMTIAYYQALFDGRLGFDLVADFRGRMNLFGLRIPTDSAEEAFSVYDHPRVMIFRKTKRYTAAAARALFEPIDLGHVVDSRWATGDPPPPPNPPLSSVVHFLDPARWAAAFAPAPKLLRPESAILLDPHRWEAQRIGGTWSGIFHRTNLANRAPLLCWAALLVFLFAVSWPYAFVVFGGLPDRGAGVARLLGIAVPLWLLWLLASAEWVTFRAGHWWVLMGMTAAGAAAVTFQRRREFGDFLRRDWRGLLAGELVFWGAFGLCLTIRYLNPDLWHANWGGEKPMEMTYLNGVMRSDYFPPYNPWYAGGFINYYYFGFVLTGGLIKALGLAPEIGFNLCLATFYGLTAAAAFTVTRAITPAARSLWPALAGSAFVALCGNLYQANYIYGCLVQLGQPDHELTIPLVSNAIRAYAGLRRAMAGQRLFTYDADPYWVAARAIPVKLADSVAPITEFPFWSYLYADLHPHLIALPYTLALMAALAAWCRTASLWTKGALAAVLAFLLGLFWPTNTWDWPTYGALTGLTLFTSCWRNGGYTAKAFWSAAARSVALFVAMLIAARVAFLPFYRHYVSGYGTFILWHGERTPFSAYLLIHGFPLFILGGGYFLFWRNRRGAEGPLRASQAWLLLLRQRFPGGNRTLRRRLTQRFERRRPSAALALGLLVIVVGLAVWLISQQSLTAFMSLGLLFSLLFAVSRRRDPLAALPFLMAALAFALSILVEYVVLDGDIGRMNTVFKFYYQAWVLFALSSAAALPEIWRALRKAAPRIRRGWVVTFGGLLLLALVYPVTATPAKIADRFVHIAPTLDGLAYMNTAHYQIRNREFALRGDLLAMRWLEDHVVGTPVILEMNTGDVLYSWGSRISVQTGLPSVVGWDWHQRQQQAGILEPRVAQRIADVKLIYNTRSDAVARSLIDKYGIGLVVVGDLERAFAPDAPMNHFARIGLEQIYDAEGTTIYRTPWVNPPVQLLP